MGLSRGSEVTESSLVLLGQGIKLGEGRGKKGDGGEKRERERERERERKDSLGGRE